MRKLLLILLLLMLPMTAHAEDVYLSAFREIPVLHEGRIKPLESFARAYLIVFSSKSSLPDTPAMDWLAELLFAPERAYQRPTFTISNPDVVNAMGLSWREGHLYSFNELSESFTKYEKTIKAIAALDDSQRTQSQRQLLGLYNKGIAYAVISQSLSLLQPRFKITDTSFAKNLQLPKGQDLTFIDLLPHEAEIFANVVKLKQKKPQNLTQQDKDHAWLAMTYLQLSKHEQSAIFRIVPPQWEKDGSEWLSPWASLLQGHGSPQSAAYLGFWKKLATAYSHTDNETWLAAAADARTKALELAGSQASPFRLKLETYYLQAEPFHAVLVLYGLSFVGLMIYFFSPRRFFYQTAAILMPLGAFIHFISIATRIIIMNRPPVATLYETTIFVSFIAVFLALLFERKRKDGTSFIVGSTVGTVLLFISTRYAADGDTMEMLVAVLNTNFWLATHVVTITMGYGCSIVAGTLAHIYLLKRLLKPRETDNHTHLINTTLAVTLIAAFFATLGTILGGIWADQSWGRFWGWDPKENGAMFIVLWLLWQLHGRIAGIFSPLNFATTMVLTNVVVALSWFGVNLLSVGLHSYGFTSNIAGNLAAFCGGEILFVLVMRGLMSHQRQGR